MSNSPVEKIKERLGIEEVVSSYIKLERAGTNLKARCPFHNEKTPSFFLSPDRGTFYCFGCGTKGDIFTFVAEFEGLDFKGALRLLAERAGVPLDQYRGDGTSASLKDRLYEVMETATKFFERNLPGQTSAVEYLTRRGLKTETAQSFRVGYAREDWRELHQHLNQAGFTDHEIEQAGLIKRSDKKSPKGEDIIYDRFRGRIMFPIMDSSGRVIAFSGRLFPDVAEAAKYLNSPETPIFKKSAVLYGLYQSKGAVRKNNFAILVEGQMDLLLAHQAGFRNTVATSGTAFSEELIRDEAVSNLGILRRMSGNLVVAFDGDNAGVKAALKAAKIGISLGMDVKVAVLPDGNDPADVIADNVDTWRAIVRESVSVVSFVLGKVLSHTKVGEQKLGKEVKERVLPFVSILGSSIDQEFFLQEISGKTGISISTLKEDLSSIAETSQNEKQAIETTEKVRLEIIKKDYILRRLVGLLWWQEAAGNKVLDTDKLTADIKEASGNAMILDELAADREDLVYEAEVFYSSGIDLNKDVSELVNNLREESLKEELARKMRELYIAEEAGDSHKAQEILKECQIISSKIQDLKNSRS